MADNSNMKSATQTYDGFIAMMKWGTVASLVVGALVVLLIAS